MISQNLNHNRSIWNNGSTKLKPHLKKSRVYQFVQSGQLGGYTDCLISGLTTVKQMANILLCAFAQLHPLQMQVFEYLLPTAKPTQTVCPVEAAGSVWLWTPE